MIIVRLKGGLGNQMFQYAAALSLAVRHHTSVKFDLSYLDDPALKGLHASRGFALGCFSLKASFATAKDLRRFRGPFTRLDKIRRRLFRHARILEKRRGYDPELFKASSGHSFLDGYFQSEAYFRGISPLIRKEFTLLSSLPPEQLTMAGTISLCQAVSVHVRRDDYEKNPEVRSYHGLCSTDYYREASGLIRTRCPQAVFFIFSDDVKWCRDNLGFLSPFHLVSPSLREPGRDIILMSQCRHHIIANSSFSWWGAWLNPRPDKIVVAPSPWYADGAPDGDALMPETWIPLPRE